MIEAEPKRYLENNKLDVINICIFKFSVEFRFDFMSLMILSSKFKFFRLSISKSNISSTDEDKILKFYIHINV